MPLEKSTQVTPSMFRCVTEFENKSPTDALSSLLEEVVVVTESTSGRLYCFSSATSMLTVLHQVGRQDSAPELDLFMLVESTRTKERQIKDLSALERAVVENCVVHLNGDLSFSRWHSDSTKSRVLLPIQREGLCIGVIDLESDAVDHFSANHIAQAQLATVVASLIMDKREALQLLGTIQRPINFHLPQEPFVSELMRLAAKATQMPYVALRELSEDESKLECIGAYGFGDLPKSTLDLEYFEEYSTFFNAIVSGETQVEPTFDADHLDRLRSRPEQSRMRSFMVTPVLVGTEVFGTLSVAMERETQYTSVERYGLEMVANAIGVAILNHRHANTREEDMFDLAKNAGALAAVEVAQAVRHEARGHVSNASIAAVILEKMSSSKGRIDANEVHKKVKEIQQDLAQVNISLDKIAQITKPPERELTTVSLRNAWEQAASIVRGRLAALRVHMEIQGDGEVEGYPDYLVQGFLNLVLNSIDAFKELRRKQNRSINVTIERSSPADTHVTIKYVDSGTGIDPSRLPLDKDGNVRAVSDIFEPGITSKPEGSGYGLYLVRRALALHHGSIDLVSYRQGTTFLLSVRKVNS